MVEEAPDDFEPLRPTLLDTWASATWHAAAIAGALRLRVFDLATKPITIEYAADRLACSDRGLRALFNLLCSLGLLREHDAMFSNTPTATAFFSRTSDAYCGDAFVQQNLVEGAGIVIANAVQLGQPPTHLPGFHVTHPAYFQELRTSLVCWPYTAKSADLMWRQVSKLARISDRSRVLDVGCGSGVRTFVLAQEFPKLQVVCIDRWGALDVARSVAEKMDVRVQVKLVEADAGQLPFKECSFDLAFAGSILCLHSLGGARAILREVRDALRPNGALVIFGPTNDSAASSGRTALLDLQLVLTTTAGRCYSTHELERIVAEEGFCCAEWIDPLTLLVRRPR